MQQGSSEVGGRAAGPTDPAYRRVVLTGGAGSVGTSLRRQLSGQWAEVVVVDRAEPGDLHPGERWVTAEVTDLGALTEAFTGAELVVHLAALPSERPWGDILATNIDGTHAVLRAAADAGVGRVLLASSIHAVGMSTPTEIRGVPVPAPRPDTYYGMSKVALEALGSLYADRFALTVVSARICTFREHPRPGRDRATWLSPGDLARLVAATARLREPGHHVVWAVSANEPGWFDLSAGRAIGFEPLDDAARLLGEDDTPPPPRDSPLGATFCDDDHPVGGVW